MPRKAFLLRIDDQLSPLRVGTNPTGHVKRFEVGDGHSAADIAEALQEAFIPVERVAGLVFLLPFEKQIAVGSDVDLGTIRD